MFWKKKQIEVAPVDTGTTTAGVVTPSATKVEASPKQKAEKSKVEKLPGPKLVPGPVAKHIIAEYKVDPDSIQFLKAVVRKRPEGERAFDCRIFDPEEAEASRKQIKDYTSLDEHPDLILYEGWFNEESKRVELNERRKVSFDVPLFTETEIQQKIEALKEAGSTVFFYQARGPAFGGPLGRGAAVVELNPNYPGKKGKKYIIYTASVVGTEPVAKKDKLVEMDKPKDIAKWIKDAHHKRMY